MNEVEKLMFLLIQKHEEFINGTRVLNSACVNSRRRRRLIETLVHRENYLKEKINNQANRAEFKQMMFRTSKPPLKGCRCYIPKKDIYKLIKTFDGYSKVIYIDNCYPKEKKSGQMMLDFIKKFPPETIISTPDYWTQKENFLLLQEMYAARTKNPFALL